MNISRIRMIYVATLLRRVAVSSLAIVYVKYPLHVTPLTLGVTLSGFDLMELVSGILSGIIVDRLGYKRNLIGGSILYLTLTLLLMASNNVKFIAAIHSALGFLTGLLLIASLTFISYFSPKESRGFEMGLYVMSAIVGIVLGVMLGRLCLNVFQDNLRISFIVVALMELLSLIFIIYSIKGYSDAYIRLPIREYFKVTLNPKSISLSTIVFNLTFLLGCVLMYAFWHLGVKNISNLMLLKAIPQMLALLLILGILIILYGKLSDILGSSTMMLYGNISLLLLVSYLIFALRRCKPINIVYVCLLSIGVPALGPSILSELSRSAGKYYGVGLTMGLFDVMFNLGQIFGLVLTGYALTKNRILPLLVLCEILIALNIAVIILAKCYRKMLK